MPFERDENFYSSRSDCRSPVNSVKSDGLRGPSLADPVRIVRNRARPTQ